jgi:diacylglycerol kinase (ATP)
MRITLVLNPDAGGGASTDELCAPIAAAGHQIEVHRAKKDGMAEALDAPGELIVVAGGDGTVGRAMKALAGSSVPMAIIPTGTANNIATSLGILGDPATLAASWHRGEVRQVDVGTARGPWGETRFVESVGVGLLAHLITPEVGDQLEGTDDARSEARRAARTLPAPERRVELDGRNLSGPYLLLEAMNIRCAGPNLWLAEQARAGDGRLEVVRALERDRATVVALADAFGTSRAVLPTERGTRLRFWCTAEELHVDDEHGTALGEWSGDAEIEVWLGESTVTVLR